jgi:hypothetical protein
MALKTMAAMVDSQNDCLDIIIDATGNLIVKILTVHGQFIKTIRKSLQADNGVVSVSLADLSSGNYVANVFNDNHFVHSIHFNKN